MQRVRPESFRALLTFLLVISGCGSSDDGSASNVAEEPDGLAPEKNDDTVPGKFASGTADPCAPLPDTGFLNDELCLADPPPDVGFQLHFGPDPADYDDPEAMDEFILEPEEESIACQYRTSPNETSRYYNRQHVRVRSGTHHMILYGAVAESADPPPDGTVLKTECGPGDGYSFVAGAQSALGPEGGTLDIAAADAPEDQGLGYVLGPRTSFGIEMHYINLTDRPILSEGWTNFAYAEDDEVKTVASPIYFIGGLGMNVKPKSSEVVQAGPCRAEEEVRILGMAGHAHAHTTRVSAFVERADGAKDLIYETYDWEEPLEARFNSKTDHLEPGDGTRDGAYSGILKLNAGDQITWECNVENALDQELRFANEAYTAEMCNIFGFYAPGGAGPWECFTF